MPLFRKKKATPPSDEHAVLTYLPLARGADFGTEDDRDAVFALEARITRAVSRVGGEHDGNTFGEGQAILYTYGPDADALFEAVRGALDDFPLRPGAYAVKRYGPPGEDTRQEAVPLA